MIFKNEFILSIPLKKQLFGYQILYFEIFLCCFFFVNMRERSCISQGGGRGEGEGGGREGRGRRPYVSLGKLAKMSNSRALASNQRPNKTTSSREACSSTLVFAALRPVSFAEILRHPPCLFSRTP